MKMTANNAVPATFRATLARLALAASLAGATAMAGATVTTVTNLANPSIYQQSITLTATITSGASPTGTVTFKDGGVTLGTGAVAAGVATYMTSTLTVGSHAITAVYGGDGTNTGSTSAVFTQIVNQFITATTLVITPNPATPFTYGGNVVLTATITGLTPSGSVTFMDGAQAIGSGTISSNVASIVVTSLAVGAHSIKAVYAGDTNYKTSTSGSTAATVNPTTSTTTLTASANPASFGQNLVLTAIVTGGPAVSGAVQFKDGSTVLGSSNVGNGIAVFQTASLALGAHSLTAVYPGDANRSSSVSGAIALTVVQVQGTTVLQSSLNPSKSGQSVTFSATVSGNSPTGTVRFKDGATVLATVALAGSSASFTTSGIAGGTHVITAVYSGDASNISSTSSDLGQAVNSSPFTLTSSVNPSAIGQAVTFTMTVNGAAPTGTVTLYDAGNTIATVALSAGGVAVYATSTLTAGDHAMNARYSGDAGNASVFSGVLTQSVGVVSPQAGWWWNPNEGGRGYTIEKRGNTLFMASYLYDVTGRATWYGIGPGSMSGSTYSGILTSYGGGQTLTGSYKTPVVTGSGGAVSISFTSSTQATMTWPGGTIPLAKYDFGPGGSAATQPAGTPEPGWWWAPAEGGRGYSFEIQGGMMFLAGYMYDAQGNPIWYASGPTAMTTPLTTYVGTWQEYANGQTLTGTWHLPTIINSNAGALTIQFSSATTGTLTFPDGRQVAIERYVF